GVGYHGVYGYSILRGCEMSLLSYFAVSSDAVALGFHCYYFSNMFCISMLQKRPVVGNCFMLQDLPAKGMLGT
ncbi:MAG: hypothetical protein WBM35_10565, partial [Candidatus Electrothrix sp.]